MYISQEHDRSDPPLKSPPYTQVARDDVQFKTNSLPRFTVSELLARIMPKEQTLCSGPTVKRLISSSDKFAVSTLSTD